MQPSDAARPDPFGNIEDLNRLRDLIARIVDDLHLAEDAARHALSRPITGEHGERDRWRLLQWRAKKYLQEHFRSSVRQRRRERVAARPESVPPADESIERIDTARFVLERLALLDEPFRSVLTRHYLEGQSPEEIARQDRVTRGAIHKQLRLGRERLRADMERKVGGPENLLGLLLPFVEARRLPLFRQLKSSTAPLIAWGVAAVLLVFVAALMWQSTDSPELVGAAVPTPREATQLAGPTAPSAEFTRSASDAVAALEIRVVRGASDQPVPNATVRVWPIPGATKSVEQIERWEELELLDELTREGATDFEAGERGQLRTEWLPNGMVLIASKDTLYGTAIVRPEQRGIVRVELYDDDDFEVLVEDEDGCAMEGAIASLTAIAYVGYGEESLTSVLQARSNWQGRAKLRHARSKALNAGPLSGLAQLTVGVAGDPHAQRVDVDLSNPGTQPIVVVWPEPTARLEVTIDGAPKGTASYSFCFACDRDMADDEWSSLVVIDGKATLPLALGGAANLRWRPTELQLVGADELPHAVYPGQLLRAEFIDVSSRSPEPCTTVVARLLDARGLPWAGREVRLYWQDVLVASALTRVDGTFELRAPCSDESDEVHSLVVVGEAGPHLSEELAKVVPALAARHELGDLKADWIDVGVWGRILDDSGASIAAARVRVLDAEASSISSLGYSVGTTCIETYSRADGTFHAPVERSAKREEQLTLVVSHPNYSDVVRVVRPSERDLVVTLPARAALRGRVQLAPSVPHHRVWVEASPIQWEVLAGDSEIGWLHRAPRFALRQTQLDADGSFELPGLAIGPVSVRVQYYGPQSRTTASAVVLHAEELELSEAGAEYRLALDLRSDFREVAVQLKAPSGVSLASDEVYVIVEQDAKGYSARAGCDSAGVVTLLVPADARAFVHSEVFFDDEIDVTRAIAEVLLERRPTIKLTFDAARPRVDSDLEFVCPIKGQGAAYAKDYRVTGSAFEVIAPNRDRFEFQFELHGGGEKQACGQRHVVELRPGFEGPYLVAAPSEFEIEVATRLLREKTQRD